MKHSHGLSVIILAGGKSRRLGKDKRSIKLNDISLIEYSLALARNVSDDIIFSSNDHLPAYEKYKVVPDANKGGGPLEGIISSMKQIKYNQALLITCDMPFITNDLIHRIISKSKDDCISHFATPEQFYPFPSLIPVSLHAKIIELAKAGNKSMKSIFKALPIIEIEIPVETFKHSFFNINHPEDFKMAQNLIDKLPDLQHN